MTDTPVPKKKSPFSFITDLVSSEVPDHHKPEGPPRNTPLPPAPGMQAGFVSQMAPDPKALASLEAIPSYELAVVEAIRLGNDTDTTATIAGGIVAVRDGLRSIPRDWMDGLQGKQQAEEIIERFITNRAPVA